MQNKTGPTTDSCQLKADTAVLLPLCLVLLHTQTLLRFWTITDGAQSDVTHKTRTRHTRTQKPGNLNWAARMKRWRRRGRRGPTGSLRFRQIFQCLIMQMRANDLINSLTLTCSQELAHKKAAGKTLENTKHSAINREGEKSGVTFFF